MARPDLGKKWNYVMDVFMDSCDAPLTAYFEAAYPAVLHAGLSYYCLDPVQIFTGYVRPAGPFKLTKGSGHGRGSVGAGKSKGFWGAFKKAFAFDPNDWVSKNLPDQQDMAGRQVPDGARWGWSGYGMAENFQNMMFMYSLVENIFYETAFGVASSPYCQNQRASVFQGYSPTQGHIPLLPVTPCVINEVQKARGVSFQGGNGVRTNTKNAHAMVSCSRIERWDGLPDTSGCWLRIVTPTGAPVTQSMPNGGVNSAAYANVRDEGYVYFEMGGDVGFTAYDVQFSVFGNRVEPTHQPADWCNEAFNKAINWVDGSRS